MSYKIVQNAFVSTTLMCLFLCNNAYSAPSVRQLGVSQSSNTPVAKATSSGTTAVRSAVQHASSVQKPMTTTSAARTATIKTSSPTLTSSAIRLVGTPVSSGNKTGGRTSPNKPTATVSTLVQNLNERVQNMETIAATQEDIAQVRVDAAQAIVNATNDMATNTAVNQAIQTATADMVTTGANGNLETALTNSETISEMGNAVSGLAGKFDTTTGKLDADYVPELNYASKATETTVSGLAGKFDTATGKLDADYVPELNYASKATETTVSGLAGKFDTATGKLDADYVPELNYASKATETTVEGLAGKFDTATGKLDADYVPELNYASKATETTVEGLAGKFDTTTGKLDANYVPELNYASKATETTVEGLAGKFDTTTGKLDANYVPELNYASKDTETTVSDLAGKFDTTTGKLDANYVPELNYASKATETTVSNLAGKFDGEGKLKEDYIAGSYATESYVDSAIDAIDFPEDYCETTVTATDKQNKKFTLTATKTCPNQEPEELWSREVVDGVDGSGNDACDENPTSGTIVKSVWKKDNGDIAVTFCNNNTRTITECTKKETVYDSSEGCFKEKTTNTCDPTSTPSYSTCLDCPKFIGVDYDGTQECYRNKIKDCSGNEKFDGSCLDDPCAGVAEVDKPTTVKKVVRDTTNGTIKVEYCGGNNPTPITECIKKETELYEGCYQVKTTNTCTGATPTYSGCLSCPTVLGVAYDPDRQCNRTQVKDCEGNTVFTGSCIPTGDDPCVNVAEDDKPTTVRGLVNDNGIVKIKYCDNNTSDLPSADGTCTGDELIGLDQDASTGNLIMKTCSNPTNAGTIEIPQQCDLRITATRFNNKEVQDVEKSGVTLTGKCNGSSTDLFEEDVYDAEATVDEQTVRTAVTNRLNELNLSSTLGQDVQTNTTNIATNTAAIADMKDSTVANSLAYQIAANATALVGKQDTISDLATIITNASNGNTAYGYFSGSGSTLPQAKVENLATTLDGKQDTISDLATIRSKAEEGAKVAGYFDANDKLPQTKVSGLGALATQESIPLNSTTYLTGSLPLSKLAETVVTDTGFHNKLTADTDFVSLNTTVGGLNTAVNGTNGLTSQVSGLSTTVSGLSTTVSGLATAVNGDCSGDRGGSEEGSEESGEGHGGQCTPSLEQRIATLEQQVQTLMGN